MSIAITSVGYHLSNNAFLPSFLPCLPFLPASLPPFFIFDSPSYCVALAGLDSPCGPGWTRRSRPPPTSPLSGGSKVCAPTPGYNAIYIFFKVKCRVSARVVRVSVCFCYVHGDRHMIKCVIPLYSIVTLGDTLGKEKVTPSRQEDKTGQTESTKCRYKASPMPSYPAGQPGEPEFSPWAPDDASRLDSSEVVH